MSGISPQCVPEIFVIVGIADMWVSVSSETLFQLLFKPFIHLPPSVGLKVNLTACRFPKILVALFPLLYIIPCWLYSL